MNELSFRAEWLETYDTMCKVQQHLTAPTRRFASLTETGKRGYPDPLDESLLHELRCIALRANLWADQRVYKGLTDTIMWNEQLELNFDEYSAQDGEMSQERLEQSNRNARNYSEEARKSIGIAIDVVRERLRASAP